MADQPAGTLSNIYLERYAYPKTFIATPPAQALGLIVTIPCFNEESLIPCLESLKHCKLPNEKAVEVIAIINESETADNTIQKKNRACYQEAKAWAEAHSSDSLAFHIFYEPLPKKYAGVGLARKIAMDEAARRFEMLGKPEGIIIGYDADCSCDKNYLAAISRYFDKHPDCPGASIYFEHPLAGSYPADIYGAIIDYELFLRYYVNALRYAGFPYAFETIGSSMAVRSHAYQKQGGMNRRKAGEDFYFLHRIIPLGNFGEINTTRVLPAPRQSDRVPFGTGRAVNEWLTKQQLHTYSLDTFEDLRLFIDHVPALFSTPYHVLEKHLPLSISVFLASIDFETAIAKIKNNTASEGSFVKQFFQWFDGFKVLKYVHFARDAYYPNQPVADMARQLLHKKTACNYGTATAKALLIAYRKHDRSF